MYHRNPKNTKRWQKSLAATEALRPHVKPEFLPLFDHCINLARDSHAHGYTTRAGQELRAARKAAAY
jgi:hypothetical protein